MAAGAVAGGLLTTVLTACSGSDEDESGGPAGAAAARAAKALRARSARTSGALLLRYDAVIARHPGHAARLTPLRVSVARHVAALTPPADPSEKGGGPEKDGEPERGGSAAPSPSVSLSAATSAPASASSAPSRAPSVGDAGPTAPPSVPDDPGAALKDLAAAERRTSDAHAAALVHAPPELARLLASLAAAGAAHAYLLTEGVPA